MMLSRNRERLLVLRSSAATLASVYRRDRTLGGLVAKVWTVLAREGLGGVKSRMLRATFAGTAQPEPAPVPAPLSYQEWIERFDTPGVPGRDAARRHAIACNLPELLILHIVARGDAGALQGAVAAWQDTVHPRWRAAILLPADRPAGERAVVERVAAADSRIRLVRSEAEVGALLAASGMVLVCHGSVRTNPLTAYMFAEAAARTGADLVYSDHDLLGADGGRRDPVFKPQFSPGYASRHNYFGDCVLLARPARLSREEVGQLASGDAGAFDRLVTGFAVGRRVEHVPFVLFHVATERDRAVGEEPVPLTGGPTVSIIIPTRDGLAHLEPCIASIRRLTRYDMGKIEIVVVDNDSRDPATLAYLDSLRRAGTARVVRYPEVFNFAAINNLGARSATGEMLVFLNDDTVVRDPDWLGTLLAHSVQPDVGVVGAKMLFPDGTIQHGGCAAGGNRGTVSHLLMHADPAAVSASDRTREMSVLTGACWALRREVFERVGGFDPVLRVTWNDVVFCLAALEAGYRNVYVADPIIEHDESRTRGADNDRAKIMRYLGEGQYARGPRRRLFQDDPFYSPNLSVEYGGGLAVPPRVRRPWSQPRGAARRILMLSSVYRFGFGVPIVIQQQARKLVERGHEVIVGGPRGDNEIAFPGCERVVLNSASEAAAYAFNGDISLVVSHTPPFFEVPLLIGPHIPVLAYDYGEPPAELFPDPTRSYLLDVEFQKRLAAPLTTAIATISQAVKDETLNPDAVVLGLANSHLAGWSDAMRTRRAEVRARHGWTDRFVVLTVCRFSENERKYKGLDKVSAILREFPYLHAALAGDVIFALAGAGSPDDVQQVRALGFSVHPNLPDAELTDLYAAADAYMSFSRWEGYNLGIAQALAMGLPIIASDIPAHREFPIVTTDSTLVACSWLAREVETAPQRDRQAIVYDWDVSTTRFAAVVEDLLRDRDMHPPRPGASACSGAVAA